MYLQMHYFVGTWKKCVMKKSTLETLLVLSKITKVRTYSVLFIHYNNLFKFKSCLNRNGEIFCKKYSLQKKKYS